MHDPAATPLASLASLAPLDPFAPRHIGPSERELSAMLQLLGFSTLQQLSDAAVPAGIRSADSLKVGPPRGEREVLLELAQIAGRNRVLRSFLGQGYAATVTPPVIQRNILENPGWYTQYTPYQAEIAQGRLEALLNFQTMIADLTAMPLANASLLDEATAAAEAMSMCAALDRKQRHRFFVAADAHPQTIAVLRTRAKPVGIEIVVAPLEEFAADKGQSFGVFVQCPSTHGELRDLTSFCQAAHAVESLVVVGTDLLALTMLTPPGEQGADIVVGNSQRFGVPMGYGGPHAAFLATRDEYKRHIPGRIIGVSKDAAGQPALRMAMQTREQHIRRDKATSNICTAQVLLAIMASMYAVYHGREGLCAIAKRVHKLTRTLASALAQLGHETASGPYFDTLRVRPRGVSTDEVHARALAAGINLRRYDDGCVGIALDEPTSLSEIEAIASSFAAPGRELPAVEALLATAAEELDAPLRRRSSFLTHPVFERFHSEHEMLRYLHRLQAKDLSLTTSMIPLGSCTMKLNATSEMLPVSWPQFAELHPFAPLDQTQGYQELFLQLERWLCDVTGFSAVSLQPNAGSQGEYSGLLAIHAYHEAQGESQRKVCLIPVSAHGTNPASAVMAGMRVVAVACRENGDIDIEDLRSKARQHASELAALMITYPSTHGVFEAGVREICDIVHEHGGQVYMDGANMNAQVGLCRPAEMGADVCHLNLHKTFCIPHGGGGPGMGPIGVRQHLAPFLPGHPFTQPRTPVGPVSAAPWGSPSILPISWTYIAMMGSDGLRKATQVAILNANYMARRLSDQFRILYTGASGLCAHEFIVDMRPFKDSADIAVDDIAKRLMDYGFHAPTMSFPVSGTLMIEPTESESKAELDRFCDALLAIREEIRAIENGKADRADNALKHAPHTMAACVADVWTHAYSREQAAFPAAWVREHKFWPSVARIDNAYGDRHLVCTCPSVAELASSL